MTTTDVDTRRIRAAKNQSLFREVNERIEQLDPAKSAVVDHEIEFICECANDECTERVALSIARYEEIRSGSNDFFVVAGHDVSEVETIVSGDDGYVVVRKLGTGMRVAETLNPRTRKR